MLVGRNPGCQIQTNNPSVSRNHVKISFEGGQFVVKDLGSSNGTFVNDAPVTKVGLNDSDMIKCGDYQIKFYDDGGGGSSGRQSSANEDPYAATSARDPQAGAKRNRAAAEQSRIIRKPKRRARGDWRDALDEDETADRVDEYRGGGDVAASDPGDDLRGENSRLRKENDEMREEISSLRSELTKARRDGGPSRGMSKDAEEDLRVKDNKISELEAKVVRHSVEVESITEKYQQLKEQTSLQKKLLDDARGDIAERDDSVTDLKDKLKALKEQMDTASSQTSESSETIANLKIKINQKERQLEEMQRQLDLFEYELKSAREENESLMASFNQGGNEVADLERRINHLQEVLTEKENVIDHLKNEVHGREVELEDTRMGMGYKELEEEKRKILENYYARDMDVERLRKQIKERDGWVAERDTRISELQSKLEAKLDLNSIAEYQEVKREIDKKVKELEIIDKKINEIVAERDEVLSAFSPEEKKRLIGENAFLKKQNTALQERCEQLESSGTKRTSLSGDADSAFAEFRSRTANFYDQLNEIINDWRNNMVLIRNYIKDINKVFEAYGKIQEEALPADVRRSLKYLEPDESFTSLQNILKIVLKDADQIQGELKAFDTYLNS